MTTLRAAEQYTLGWSKWFADSAIAAGELVACANHPPAIMAAEAELGAQWARL